MSAVPTDSPGLYIHFPWCVKKCPYCDFNSHRVGTSLDQPRYIETLLADLDYELGEYPVGNEVRSIFMGGGTPSLFSPDSMADLMVGLGNRLSISPNAEVTMEANPGTTEHADFAAYKQAGINRLSIGVQSFHDTQLVALGRVHCADEAHHAYANARQGGFDNINLDLMFALPDQTVEQALSDIDTAISLAPDHLSAYQLTLEPDTVFYRYPPNLPSADNAWEIETALQQRLAESDYLRYEISAYSQPGKRCKHNLNYWQFGDYIGIGAGAHGKRTVDGTVIRRSRKKHPATYIDQAGKLESIAETRTVAESEMLFEYLMNALRLIDGVTMENIARFTSMSQQSIVNSLQKAMQQRLVTLDNGMLKCSQNGQLFLDSILADLLD